MLKLVWCEIYKFKRNKTILILTSLALLFPAALTLFTKSNIAEATNTTEFHVYYDSLFNNNLVYSSMLLLPCLFGCISAILFFSERDCDTFKNLQVIPVTRNRLIFAKLIVMYLWSEIYSIVSVLSVTVFCLVLEPLAIYDVLFKLLCSIIVGITMATVCLPIVVIVIYMNQSYLLSLLMSFMYTVVNWLLFILFASNDSALLWLPLMNGLMFVSRLGAWRKAVLGMSELVPLPFGTYMHVVLYLLFAFVICILLIVRFYKKWSR